MDKRPHKAQLRICHERISDGAGKWAYCDLKAGTWCYDCDYFVCRTHRTSRHLSHKTGNGLND